MNKKGIQDYLVYTILTVIIIVILTAIILRATGGFGSTVNEATCEASVYARSSDLLKGGVGGVSPEIISLKCATSYKCFTSGGTCPTGYEKIIVISDQEIKQKLAEEMYSCWKMLGKGKIRFVSNTFVSESACLPCSVIAFDDKLKGKSIEGFQTYLSITNTSDGITYLQYLSGAKNVDIVGSDAVIYTDKQYVINYGLYSGQYLSDLVEAPVGAAATVASAAIGCKAGTIIGGFITGIPTGGVGAAPGAVIGCGVGGIGGTAVGLYATLKSTPVFTYIASRLGFQKEIYASMSLDEYSAETLKACKSFANI